jgi:hypothetical protein
MADRVEAIWSLMDDYEKYKAKGLTMDMLLAGDRMQEKAKEILRMQGEILSWRRDKKDEISPDMIERAKAYPFDQLIDFKHRSAMCPFHEGNSPALRYYPDKNIVWCFACVKGWDPIQWVRDKEGVTFQESVRRLQ